MTKRITIILRIKVGPSDEILDRADYAESLFFFEDRKMMMRTHTLYRSDTNLFVQFGIARIPFAYYRTQARVNSYLYLKDDEGGIYTTSTFSIEDLAKTGATGQGGVTQDYVDMCKKIIDAINASGSSSGS